jgi:protein-disulfide isomerase
MVLAVVCGCVVGCGPAGTPAAPGAAESSAEQTTGSDATPPAGQRDPAADTPAPPQVSTPPATAHFDPADVPSRGPADAEVVVQVFSDFECPYCGMARRYTDRLLRDFPSVRFEYRHFPLTMHPHAALAAEAAVEAYAQGGNEAFWCYQEALFDRQSELSRDRMVSLARGCGLDGAALAQALDTGRHRERVARDRSEGEQLGVQGTPSFTVNGELVDGAEYIDVEEAVDRALARR